MTERLDIVASDGIHLEAEIVEAESVEAGASGAPRAAMVICHPHPQFGGTMRSVVVSALFEALPASGVTCLRFNFRGVEGSAGACGEGRGERVDASAAVATLAERIDDDIPLVLSGWSFGADMALTVADPRLAAWLLIAPPLRFASDADRAPVATDPRPKLLVLGEHDEFRPPAEVTAATASWSATDVEIVGGASHFFIGRTDRLVALAHGFVDRVVGPPAGS